LEQPQWLEDQVRTLKEALVATGENIQEARDVAGVRCGRASWFFRCFSLITRVYQGDVASIQEGDDVVDDDDDDDDDDD